MVNIKCFATLALALALGLARADDVGAQVGVQGEPIKVQSARPGETYTGVFVIRNTSPLSQEVSIYQTDYVAQATGTIYGEPGSVPRSNARWITVGPSRVVVPPSQSLDIPFTVAVPAAVPASGSFWSMVMVETVPRGSAQSSLAPPDPKKGTITIAARFRSAVQIVTNIGNDLKRDAQFEAPTALVAKDSSRGLQFDLRNTGTIAFMPTFTVELYAEDGTHVNTFTTVRELTYPGNSFRQQFNFGRLPAGKYRTIVTMDAGESAVFGAQYTFRF